MKWLRCPSNRVNFIFIYSCFKSTHFNLVYWLSTSYGGYFWINFIRILVTASLFLVSLYIRRTTIILSASHNNLLGPEGVYISCVSPPAEFSVSLGARQTLLPVYCLAHSSSSKPAVQTGMGDNNDIHDGPNRNHHRANVERQTCPILGSINIQDNIYSQHSAYTRMNGWRSERRGGDDNFQHHDPRGQNNS